MSELERVVDAVWRLPLLLGSVNAYLVDDVLIDSGTAVTARGLLEALSGRRVSAHVLTHVHPDHQGASHRVCEELSIGLRCGAGDREATESGDMESVLPPEASPAIRMIGGLAGPGHPVEHVLREGDLVADFEVLETPGHTPGHIALWRAGDGVLILGDVVMNRHPVLPIHGLREPLAAATWNKAANRESARRLAKLRPRVVCFGHGEPLRDSDVFGDFVARLPR